jgi:hypothetical protein
MAGWSCWSGLAGGTRPMDEPSAGFRTRLPMELISASAWEALL